MSDEGQIYDYIAAVVLRETARIHDATTVRYDDLSKLLTLARIYAILKGDLRDDCKSGITSAAAKNAAGIA